MKKSLVLCALCLFLALSLCACGPRSSPSEPSAVEPPPAAAPQEELPMTEEEALQTLANLRQLRLDAPWESCQDISVANYILWFGYGLQEQGELNRYIQDDWDCARFPAQELEVAVCDAFCLSAEELRRDTELFVVQQEESYYLLPYALYPYLETTTELREIDFQGEDLALHFTLYYPDYVNSQEQRPLCLLLEQKDKGWRYKALLEDAAD